MGGRDEQKVRQRELDAKEGVKDYKEIVTKRSKVLKDKKTEERTALAQGEWGES